MVHFERSFYLSWFSVPQVISHVGGNNGDNADDYLSDRFLNGGNNSIELKYFVRGYAKPIRGRDMIPIRIMTLSDSKVLYPDVPHAWLCDGKLLRLLDSDHPGNYIIFQVSRYHIGSNHVRGCK